VVLGDENIVMSEGTPVNVALLMALSGVIVREALALYPPGV
jgi:hypothetical protein